MPTNRGILEEQGFNRFNRREDYTEPVVYDIPLSVTNQVIPDGSFDLSKVNLDTFVLLKEETVSTAVDSITIGGIPEKAQLKILVYITGLSGAGEIYMRFNSDTGAAQYDYQQLDWAIGAVGSPSGNTSAGFIKLTGSNSDGAGGYYFTIEIVNISSGKKHISMYGKAVDGTSASLAWSVGTWNNVTDLINSITFYTNTATNFLAGTNIKILGM